jgi:hypothetical protein
MVMLQHAIEIFFLYSEIREDRLSKSWEVTMLHVLFGHAIQR